MKILFLDQSGQLGGAELSLLDLASFHRETCLVGLFADGMFRQRLEARHIPVHVLAQQALHIHKDSGFWHNFCCTGRLLPLIWRVVQLSRSYDLIYANTQKAFVIGAIASLFSRRPLIYHLRDILSDDHFSKINIQIAIFLANQVASLIIANSKATQAAFIQSGGRPEKITVVYNGFNPNHYQNLTAQAKQIRQDLGLTNCFVVGHFSRLSPWKGQHILLQALTHCPENVVALFVGDALFGEQDYVAQLHQLVEQLELQHRVQFLGFRSDIPELMSACDLVAHTSTAPEPFGRVIIEAMLCGSPVVAAAAGGAIELVDHGVTGWIATPGDPLKLARIIQQCCDQPDLTRAIATQAQVQASQNFSLATTHQQIEECLLKVKQSCLKP
jgi:glycosyltransferase involved in cell wall biosynthesis